MPVSTVQSISDRCLHLYQSTPGFSSPHPRAEAEEMDLKKTIRLVLVVEVLSFLFSYVLLVAEVEAFYFYIEALIIVSMCLGSVLLLVSVHRALTSSGPRAGSATTILLAVLVVFIPAAFVFVIFSQLH